MKRFLLPLLCVFALIAGTPLLAANGPPAGASKWNQVAAMLQFMREEEKLARDVYLALDKQYGEEGTNETNTFANIAKSEQDHTVAVRDLLVDYGVEDPAADTDVGEFENDDLQDLYYTLVEIGEKSLADALQVGVTIENKDITDIAAAIDLSRRYPDIVRVYSNLLAGSENHLAAFLAALEQLEDD